MNATDRLVQHIIDIDYDDLSAEAVKAAKTFFLDTIGVTVAGTSAPVATEVGKAVSAWGSGDEATVFGLDTHMPATSAALINGFHAHCQEFDCVHEPAVVHPLASIQSGVLAWCQRQTSRSISGRELILALCIGVDVATTIGMASRKSLRFFRPATAGVFGTTAAIAKLAGLDKIALLDALGAALAQCSGTMQAHVEGKPTLALLVGMAARAGIQSVDLASAGVSGPHDVLEGPFGYYPLIEGDWDTEPAFSELGKIWRMTQVSHKPFPCGRANHGGIAGIQQLQKNYAISAKELESLELLAPPLIHQLVGRPLQDRMSVNYARLCFQYVAAVALSRGNVDIPDFRAESLGAADLHALARRISVRIDDNPDPNALVPQRVVIRRRDGSRIEAAVAHSPGSPEYPLTEAEHLDKFRRCWSYCAKPLPPQNAETLIGQVNRLDQVENINDILALISCA